MMQHYSNTNIMNIFLSYRRRIDNYKVIRTYKLSREPRHAFFHEIFQIKAVLSFPNFLRKINRIERSRNKLHRSGRGRKKTRYYVTDVCMKCMYV